MKYLQKKRNKSRQNRGKEEMNTAEDVIQDDVR